MLKSYLVLILIFFLGFQVYSSDACLKISNNNCDFYKICVESQYPCGSNGYALSYGDYYCHKFLNIEPRLSEKGQLFLQDVRLCLQKDLSLLVFQNLLTKKSTQMTCEKIEENAFASHSYCYTTARVSICELNPVRDLRLIFAEYDAHDLWTQKSAKQMVEVADICLAQLTLKMFSKNMSLGQGSLEDIQQKIDYWESVRSLK